MLPRLHLLFRSLVLTLPILLGSVVLPGLGSSRLHAQESLRARFQEARLAWDAGDYVVALEELEDLLREPGADRLRDEIALLTGELYRVREITDDGSAVRWSPDGRFAAYETGAGGEEVTRILRMEAGAPDLVAEVEGTGLVFGPRGRKMAFLVLEETEALEDARARIREEIAPTDRASYMRLRAALAALDARFTTILIQDLSSGSAEGVRPDGPGVRSLLYHPGSRGLFFLGSEEGSAAQIYRLTERGEAEAVTRGPEDKAAPFFAAGGSVLVYESGARGIGLMNLDTGEGRELEGRRPVVSADGRTLAFLGGEPAEPTLNVLSLAEAGASPRVIARVPFPVAAGNSRACSACPLQTGLALSTDGSTVAFQGMPREDSELFLVPTDGPEADPLRFTREIQHDLFPRFLETGSLLAMKGEGRHRRSFLYDPETGQGTRLFRNNTLRTVAPEYEWAPSPDGTKLLVVAERDGNTVSPERGVYLVDLENRVTVEDLLARVRRNLAAETTLRAKATEMFEPVAGEIRDAVDRVSVPRLFDYQEALYAFGSKYITRPGNRMALDYLAEKLREFGYEPELQWFEPRGVRSANVIARIPGTVSPEIVYAVSAHFDSNYSSPGADDNNSATAGLLEMARILVDRPLPATLEIAFFTGEEAGLLGSREYVRRAVESGKKLVGALNNDMVGWAENHRLDNTIRYSNDGIRDVQHGAAILFSDLITYDAKYYKSTDAAAYYDAYGDIVGGIGSYPILANPHYHRVHDILPTVNHQLVAEVAKTTLASAMILASIPSRLTGLTVEETGTGSLDVRWNPAVENDVARYLVAYGPEADPEAHIFTVTESRVEIEDPPPGTVVSVKAVNDRGMRGWDWARARTGR